MENLELLDPQDTKEDKIDIDQLIRVYINVRASRDEKVEKHKEEIQKLDEKMALIQAKLLEEFKQTNADSVSTSSGTAYRKLKTTYSTHDWESFYNFVNDNKAPELLQKRIHQGNMKEWLDKYPTDLPIGLNTTSEYTITVRRKGKK
jgi:uncharacterized Ntn-hydrolase superfamily protein